MTNEMNKLTFHIIIFFTEDLLAYGRWEGGKRKEERLLFGGGIPLYKNFRYQGPIWGYFPIQGYFSSLSFTGTKTSLRVTGPLLHKKSVQIGLFLAFLIFAWNGTWHCSHWTCCIQLATALLGWCFSTVLCNSIHFAHILNHKKRHILSSIPPPQKQFPQLPFIAVPVEGLATLQ